MVDKSDIARFVYNSDLNKKLATLATKTELKAGQDKIIKSQAFDSSYFRGKSQFEDDGTQNYLVFQQCTNIFLKLVILNVFQHGNLKDCLMEVLILLLHLIIVLLQH